MTESREVAIILMGVGNVGGALLRQVVDTRDVLARRTGLALVPIALADISGVLFDRDGLADETLQAARARTGSGGLLASVKGTGPLREINRALRPGAILADMTASNETAATLLEALAAESGVVLANKLPLVGPWPEVRSLFEHRLLRYEVTVGAGLPVISTFQYLMDTGDTATGIEGCLSGTLGYVCSQLERGSSYSAAVSQARSLGYTEPDPREDLGGHDVARKALILARTAGWPLELSDIEIEPMYPAELARGPVDEFIGAMPTQDQVYAERVEKARAQGQVLRYVAQVGPEGGRVGLVAVDQASQLGALRGPGNYIALQTQRYSEIPLILSGPGAGPEVTAAGVLGDVVRLAQTMARIQP